MRAESKKNMSAKSSSQIFKKMLEDKKAIHQHLQEAGKLSDIKDKYSIVKTISLTKK